MTTKIITRYGNTTQTTAIKDPWGGNRKVGYFDGNGDYLFAAHSTEFDFGNAAYFVEAWVYPTGNEGLNRYIVCTYNADGYSGAFHLRFHTSNKIYGQIGDRETTIVAKTSTITSLNKWYHVRLLKTNDRLYIYLNGELNGSTYPVVSTPISPVDGVYIGNSLFNNYYYAGYMCDLKIQKLVNPTPQNFTVPSSPAIATLNTILLLPMNGSGGTFVDYSMNKSMLIKEGFEW